MDWLKVHTKLRGDIIVSQQVIESNRGRETTLAYHICPRMSRKVPDIEMMNYFRYAQAMDGAKIKGMRKKLLHKEIVAQLKKAID